MSEQCLSHNTVKTRKQYRCVLCGLRIRKGCKAIIDAGIYDGEFYSHRCHAVCYDAWLRTNDDGEFMDESEFRRDVLGLPLIGRENRCAN